MPQYVYKLLFCDLSAFYSPSSCRLSLLQSRNCDSWLVSSGHPQNAIVFIGDFTCVGLGINIGSRELIIFTVDMVSLDGAVGRAAASVPEALVCSWPHVLSIWSLHVIPLNEWICSKCSSFLPCCRALLLKNKPTIYVLSNVSPTSTGDSAALRT